MRQDRLKVVIWNCTGHERTGRWWDTYNRTGQWWWDRMGQDSHGWTKQDRTVVVV